MIDVEQHYGAGGLPGRRKRSFTMNLWCRVQGQEHGWDRWAMPWSAYLPVART